MVHVLIRWCRLSPLATCRGENEQMSTSEILPRRRSVFCASAAAPPQFDRRDLLPFLFLHTERSSSNVWLEAVGGGGSHSVYACFPGETIPPPELERRVVGLFFAMQLIIRASTGLCVGDGQTVNETWTPPKLSKLILHPCAKSESQRCVQILADNVNVWFFFLFFGQIWCRNCKCLFCFFFRKLCWKCSDHRMTREKYAKKKKKVKMTRGGETDGRTVSGGKTSRNVLWIFSLDSSQREDLIWNGGKLSQMSVNPVRATEVQSFSPLIAP